MGSQRVTQISSAMCLLECVECVRAVMNSKIGLEYFIHHEKAIEQLVTGKVVRQQCVLLLTIADCC